MDARVIPRQVELKKPQPVTDRKLSFIETKFFLNAQLELIANEKMRTEGKTYFSAKLATNVRTLMRTEDRVDRAVITENLGDHFSGVFEKVMRTPSSDILKNQIEAMSEGCWIDAKETHHLYLMRFLGKLHRFLKKICESEHEELIRCAVMCLHARSLDWASKSNGWAKAYEEAIKPAPLPVAETKTNREEQRVSEVKPASASLPVAETKTNTQEQKVSEKKPVVTYGHFRNGCEGALFGFFSGAAGAFICRGSVDEIKTIAATAAAGSAFLYGIDNRTAPPLAHPAKSTEPFAPVGYAIIAGLSGLLGNLAGRYAAGSEQSYSGAMLQPAIGAVALILTLRKMYSSWIVFKEEFDKAEEKRSAMKP